MLLDDTVGEILYIKILTHSTKAFKKYNYITHLTGICAKVLNQFLTDKFEVGSFSGCFSNFLKTCA